MSEGRLAVLTSGGDAPGMNMALWTLCFEAERAGLEVLGVRAGFEGLLARRAEPLRAHEVLPWARRGGTLLGSSRVADLPSRRSQAAEALAAMDVQGLVVLGGNGSLRAAAMLADHATVVGLPATIDNDVPGCPLSLGFDTALHSAVTLADAIRDSAESIPRLFGLETLGGDTGFLAEAVGRAVAADVVLTPERPLPEAAVAERLRPVVEAGRAGLLVASEGYPDLAGTWTRIASAVGMRVRPTRVGHAQRGGPPSPRDRLLARALAEEAVRACRDGHATCVVPTAADGVTRVPHTAEPRRPAS